MINLRPGKKSKDLKVGEVIKFAIPQSGLEFFVVSDADVDLEKRAMFLGIWKFTGGYDHFNLHIILSDHHLNEVVEVYEPIKKTGIIKKIKTYRGINKRLSPKEEFYFDTYADETSPEKTEYFNIPYEIIVEIDGIEEEFIIPAYTPLQHPLPLGGDIIGKKVEVWEVEGERTIMKILP